MTKQVTKSPSISKTMINRRRWLAYLDLLGVKNLINNGNLINVVKIYEQAIDDLHGIVEEKNTYGINSMWFSDTFIIYSEDDSSKSFSLLEQATRLFFDKLIISGIPVRGAISIGDLYTNKKKGVIVGDALVSAYEYGENQNWLGLLLTPNAIEWMCKNDLAPEKRLNYNKLTDPEVMKIPATFDLYAYRMSQAYGDLNNQLVYKNIVKLRNIAPQSAKPKYDRTIKFIQESKLKTIEN
jgi:hypothetical protein